MASNKNNNHTVFRPSVFSREEIETDTVIHPEKLSRNKKGLYTGNKTDYTEEDIKNFKLINWKKAHPGVSIQNNAVASLDYSHIENDELRHSFIELCVDFHVRRREGGRCALPHKE